MTTENRKPKTDNRQPKTQITQANHHDQDFYTE